MSETVHYAKTDAEIERCKEAWERMQWDPNGDFEFYKLGNKFRKEIETPCIVQLRSGDTIRSLWAGRIERVRLPLRFGYIRFKTLPLRQLTIVSGGIMGDTSEQSCRTILSEVLALLRREQIDQLHLGYLPFAHPLFRLAAKELPSWLCRDWAIRPDIHWTMSLPSTYEELLKRRSKKHRYWLNRLPRVLESTYPGEVSFRLFTEPGEVDQFAQDARAVAERSWQHATNVGAFHGNEEEMAKCRVRAASKSFRGAILYIKNVPSAYWLASAYQGVLHLHKTGYCQDLRKFEVGTVLLLWLFSNHCGRGVDKVDFGHGNAPYKERFGDSSYEESSVRVYRLGFKGTIANLIAWTGFALNQISGKLLHETGLYQRLKTLWKKSREADKQEKSQADRDNS